MENVRASNRVNAIRIDSDKTATNFVKDAPKITRYSLADLADGSSNGMDYHIEIINKDDKLRVLKFLRRFFFRDEPLNQSIQLIPEGEDSTCAELEEYCCNASFENNMSLMAVSASGTIVGVLLNELLICKVHKKDHVTQESGNIIPSLKTGNTAITCFILDNKTFRNSKMDNPLSNEEPEYIRSCKNAKFKKILRLLHHLDKNVNMGERFRDSKILEVRIISVDTNWRGRGVGTTLMGKTAEMAKEQGYHYLRVDCTSVFSAKMCERLGYDQIYKINYKDYVDEDGKPIFSPISPHIAAVSYVKKL